MSEISLFKDPANHNLKILKTFESTFIAQSIEVLSIEKKPSQNDNWLVFYRPKTVKIENMLIQLF